MMALRGKNFFWFAAGVAMLLLAGYGIFSGRLQEFVLTPKTGEFKFVLAPASSKNTMPAAPAVAAKPAPDQGGVLSMQVPGVGNVRLTDDDFFLMAIEQHGAIVRNASIVETAINEDKTGVRHEQTDPNGTFWVWTKLVDFNDQRERCVHLTTLYKKLSGENEWGLLRACKGVEGWRIEIEPDFVSLMSRH